MNDPAKITTDHLRRNAVIYVRQSTSGQVEQNRESTDRQYRLAERAVELGWVNGVVIEVLSSFEDVPGTRIKEDPLVEQRNKVRGLAHDRNVAKLTLVEVPDRPGVAAAVFQPLAEAGINVDMIVQNVGHGGATDLSFTIPQVELAKARRILEPIARELGFRELTTDSAVAKVSIVGAGIQNAVTIRKIEDFKTEGLAALERNELGFFVCKVEESLLHREIPRPTTDLAENKYTFVRYLEHTEKKAIAFVGRG